MHELKWSEREKTLSRRVFESARERELAQTLADFKARVERLTTVEEMWSLQDHLRRRQREIDETYDYRYSQLLVVFGRLLREQRIDERDLEGLAEDKLACIRRIAAR